MTPAPKPAPDRLWFAQLLRALACGIICYTHLGSYLAHNEVIANLGVTQAFDYQPNLPHRHVERALLGPVGVRIGYIGLGWFFLLSGFGVPFLLERYGTAGFLANRAVRIFPVYWVCLGLTCAALAVYWHGVGGAFPRTAQEVMCNAVLSADCFAGARSVDLVNWTLEIDLRFYVGFAAWMWLGGVKKCRATVAVALACALFALFLQHHVAVCVRANEPLPMFPLALSKAAPYIVFALIGTCFYRLYRKEWSVSAAGLTIGALLGLWLWCAGGAHTPAKWDELRRNFLIALGLFAACYAARERLPYCRWLEGIAKLSYPIYLLHGVIGYILLWTGHHYGLPAYVNLAITLGLVLGLAWLVHRLVERPANDLARAAGRRLSRRPPPTNRDQAPGMSEVGRPSRRAA
jgi:peptidoglycan/LPS O-acetylase OafA/YrhL